MLKIKFRDHQSSKHPQEWTKSGLRSKIGFQKKMVISRWGASKSRSNPGALTLLMQDASWVCGIDSNVFVFQLPSSGRISPTEYACLCTSNSHKHILLQFLKIFRVRVRGNCCCCFASGTLHDSPSPLLVAFACRLGQLLFPATSLPLLQSFGLRHHQRNNVLDQLVQLRGHLLGCSVANGEGHANH